ncbi:MAG: GNAT family N-acetyltransferase [Clostridiales bacterium]|nr:GNAT family N-acetyltransferase [Clostridiales bacterium]
MDYIILKINLDRISDLAQLKIEADNEGYNFVRRTIADFESGKNNFTGKGEILYGAYAGDLCLGICGLNIDPYTNNSEIGRLRHLYISEQFRNNGIATMLVNKVINRAKNYFAILRLKSTPEANRFYEKLGFEENINEHESHRMVLER